MVKMLVEGIAIDRGQKTFVVLRDQSKRFYIPIWIGPAEAMAIQVKLENKRPPRPMTHDLMSSLINGVKASVRRIVVNDYRDTIFYAEIALETQGGNRNVDARPSDAIALALRQGAPIFVADHVVAETAISMVEEDEDEITRFKDLIGEE